MSNGHCSSHFCLTLANCELTINIFLAHQHTRYMCRVPLRIPFSIRNVNPVPRPSSETFSYHYSLIVVLISFNPWDMWLSSRCTAPSNFISLVLLSYTYAYLSLCDQHWCSCVFVIRCMPCAACMKMYGIHRQSVHTIKSHWTIYISEMIRATANIQCFSCFSFLTSDCMRWWSSNEGITE